MDDLKNNEINFDINFTPYSSSGNSCISSFFSNLNKLSNSLVQSIYICHNGNIIIDCNNLNLINSTNQEKWFDSLTSFQIIQSNMKNLDWAKDLKNLTYLRISESQLEDLYGIQNLENLETLYFDSNKIYDLTPIANMKNIKTLMLDDNSLTNRYYLDNIKNYVYNIQIIKGLPQSDLTVYARTNSFSNVEEFKQLSCAYYY